MEYLKNLEKESNGIIDDRLLKIRESKDEKDVVP
jgi:hypothetical protein